MFKRVKVLFGFIIALLVTTCSIGLSYWYFGGTSYTPDVNEQIMVDNIKENYIFGRDDHTTKTYTIYLFPSVVYADIYQRYLDSLNTTNPTTKPEDAFGYFTVDLDESGNKSIHVEKNSSYTYNNVEYKNYYSLVNSSNYNNQYLSDDYDDVYSEAYIVNDSAGNKHILNGLGEPNMEPNYLFTIEEKNDFSNPEGFGNRFDKENQYSFDRFGAWGDLHSYPSTFYQNLKQYEYDETDFDLGRYLPQKLVVTQSIKIDDFINYTMEPITSMGDRHSKYGWYNMEFTGWVTYSLNESGYESPYLYNSSVQQCLGAFCAGDVNSYFDIMRNLDEYADSDGVVRLFPYFSNGKGYVGNEYNHGRRDVIRIETTEVEIVNDANVTSKTTKYFMYNSNVLDYTNPYCLSADINNAIYAVYPNFEINSKITSIDISIGYNKEIPEAGSWPGNWARILYLNSTAISNLVKRNGEGLYNFYTFVADGEYVPNDTWEHHTETSWFPPWQQRIEYDPEHYTNDASDTDNENIDKAINNMFSNATSNDSWGELKNKKLIKFDDYTVTAKSIWPIWNYDGSSFTNTNYGKVGSDFVRPIVLTYEKVSESRLYKGVNGTYSDFNEYNTFINNSYDNANAFVMTSGDTYGMNANDDGSLIVDQNKNYSANNPYIYLVKDIDLTDLGTNNLFQILFNKTYNNQIRFVLNDTSVPSKIVYNPDYDTNGIVFNEYNIFDQASNYFSSSSIAIQDGTGTYSCFKVDKEGVYDFLLIYNMKESTESGTDNVYVYCRRHENNFVKLFESKGNIEIDDDHFAIHVDSNGKELSTLVWKTECAVGDKLTPETIGGKNEKEEISFSSAVENFIATKSNIDLSKGETISESVKANYFVKDYVTGEIVLYYNSTTHKWVGNFELRKNYLLYIATVTDSQQSTNS